MSRVDDNERSKQKSQLARDWILYFIGSYMESFFFIIIIIIIIFFFIHSLVRLLIHSCVKFGVKFQKME